MRVSHSDVIILLGLLGNKCRYQTQTCFGYLYRVGDVKVYLKYPLIHCDPSSDNHREEGQETYPAEEHDAGDSCTGY
jgi:hypothetical protein